MSPLINKKTTKVSIMTGCTLLESKPKLLEHYFSPFTRKSRSSPLAARHYRQYLSIVYETFLDECVPIMDKLENIVPVHRITSQYQFENWRVHRLNFLSADSVPSNYSETPWLLIDYHDCCLLHVRLQNFLIVSCIVGLVHRVQLFAIHWSSQPVGHCQMFYFNNSVLYMNTGMANFIRDFQSEFVQNLNILSRFFFAFLLIPPHQVLH